MPTRVRILSTARVTHNVRHYRVEKPKNFRFGPGQATEVSIDKPEWADKKRPFTFTSLMDEPTLEFTIKSYRDHPGVTNALWAVKPGIICCCAMPGEPSSTRGRARSSPGAPA